MTNRLSASLGPIINNKGWLYMHLEKTGASLHFSFHQHPFIRSRDLKPEECTLMLSHNGMYKMYTKGYFEALETPLSTYKESIHVLASLLCFHGVLNA